MNKIKIVEFTDPACTWCWGSEPVLRKLETYYRENIEIHFIMGGLVNDIRQFRDSFHGIGGDTAESNKNIANHWLEASERHGMPVEIEGFQLFTEDHPSTYPMNIAYKAAQFEDQILADKFLRRMREAVAAEAIPANRPEKLIELAGESGLDIGKFIQHIKDGSAEHAFHQDLKTTIEYKAQGFPSFLVQYGDKGVMLRGYQIFDNFKNVIDYLSNNEAHGSLVEATNETILSFIEKYGRVAAIEIQESFGLNNVEVDEKLKELESQDAITITPVGNGQLITIKKNPLFCDPDTGVCHI